MRNRTFASEDEALEETKRLLNSDPSLSLDDPTLPVFQYFAIEQLKLLEDSAKKDKFFLMKAIALCAKHGLVMPEWVARSYHDAYRKITSAEQGSWDAVFGKPYPKGTHLNALRKRRLRFLVYDQVIHALKKHPELAIDNYLFEQIGKKYCISGSTTKELYYEVKETLGFTGIARPRQLKIVVQGDRPLKKEIKTKANHKDAKRRDLKDVISPLFRALHATPSREVKT